MENKETKKSKKSGFVTAAFFAFSLIVVAVIAIREFTGEKNRHIENPEFNFIYLLCGIGCFLLALLCESTKYSYLLRGKGIKNRRKIGFSCAVIGKYYDNLTPAGAGGQGFQIYHLKKNGCDDGTAGALPIIGFLTLQFSFVLIGILTMIMGRRYIEDVPAVRFTAIAGIIFYAFIPVCIIFFAIAPNILKSIVQGFTNLLGKVHILKHPETAAQRAVDSLSSYTDSLKAFGRNTRQILVVSALSLIYQLAFMVLPYFVLRFFGAHMGLIECFCKVVYIYAAIAVIFTPGNSGAAEVSFYTVFESLSGGEIFWGMLVWRALCYYSWIAIGAVIQIRERIEENKINKINRTP